MEGERFCGLCGKTEEILGKDDEVADFDFCKSCLNMVIRQYRNSMLINHPSGFLSIPTMSQSPSLPEISPQSQSKLKKAAVTTSFTIAAQLRKLREKAKRGVDCEEHLGKPASYFCDRNACRKFVCNICVNDLGVHYEHPAVLIPQYIQYSKTRLKTIMHTLEENEETALFMLKRINQNHKTRWNSTYQEMKLELTEIVSRTQEVRGKLRDIPLDFSDNDVMAILVLQLVLRIFSRQLAYVKDSMGYIVGAYQKHFYD